MEFKNINFIDYRKRKYLTMIEELLRTSELMTKTHLKKTKFYFSIQNEEIIVRNIELLNIKRKKDIINMIEYEITQYLPIDISNYKIKYRILNKNKKNMLVQVILIPQYIIEIVEEISKKFKLEVKYLTVEVEILQKLIKDKIINNIESNGVFINLKQEGFVLNLVQDKIVKESCYMKYNEDTYDYINHLSNTYSIYEYGLKQYTLRDYLSEEIVINRIEINKKIQLINEEDCSKYINSIGVVI